MRVVPAWFVRMTSIMRAFVAIALSESVRQAVGDFIADLRRVNAPVKWVRPENLHLTLKFLGDVPDENVSTVIEILQRCVDGLAPFQLHVKGTGGFPNLRRPRVIFVNAQDTPPTAHELARRLNDGMTEASIAREKRGFRNHITIARVRRPQPMPAIEKRIAAMSDRDFGSMTVPNIVLVRSDLRPDGPVYTPVEQVMLSETNNL